MSDTKWIPGNWEDVKVGDFVQVRRGREMHQFAVQFYSREIVDILRYGATHRNATFAKSEGWSLFVEAPAVPELPTDIGTVLWVRATDTNHWIVLTTDGWKKLHFGELFDRSTLQEILSVIAAPPAATSKAVLERLAELTEPGNFGTLAYARMAELREQVAAEFGVTK